MNRSTERPRARALALGFAFAASLAVALQTPDALAQSTASAEAKAGARAAAERGTVAFQEGRFADAIDLYQRAESLFHAPTHGLMLARSYAALGKLVLAKESYLSVSREELDPKAPAAFKKAQTEAEKELKDLDPRIPSIEVTAAPPAAKNLVITMDGKPVPAALVGIPRPVDPGTHVFAATADGLAAPDTTVTVKERASEKLLLQLKAAAQAPADTTQTPPPPADLKPDKPIGPDQGASEKPNGMRIASFAAMGLGVVGLGVGGVFAGLSLSKRSEANAAFDECGVGCFGPQADGVRALDEDANQKGTIGVIGLAAGGALAISGVVLFLVSGKKNPPAQTTTSVMPFVGPRAGGFVVKF